MTWLIAPHASTERHQCNLPNQQQTPVRLKGQPELAPTFDVLNGALWRCSCGQHWLVCAGWWRPISNGRARRLIRRARQTKQTIECTFFDYPMPHDRIEPQTPLTRSTP